MTAIVIVGAGPAGIAAASACAAHGYRPLVIDEGRRAGGQVYRRPTGPVRVDAKRMLGAQAKGYRRVHGTFAALEGRIDYRPQTLVWTVADRRVHTLCDSRVESHPYDALILATGATDRLIPVQGWTAPGVFSLGAAQVLLKDQGCLIGRSTVFCGSSPLLYLAALQYVRAGGAVAIRRSDAKPIISRSMLVSEDFSSSARRAILSSVIVVVLGSELRVAAQPYPAPLR